jgi:hypothetical protein
MEERSGDAAAGSAAMKRRSIALGLAALFAAADAGAQFGGMGGMGGGRRGGSRGGASARSDAQPRESVDMLQVNLEELRTDLKLTPEQQPRWDSYREKVEALAGDIGRSRKRPDPEEKLDAVQQLKRLVDTQRNRLAAMEDIADAGSALYNSLTAQQKQLADQRLAKVMGTMPGSTA